MLGLPNYAKNYTSSIDFILPCDSNTPERDVWINEPLMPSSDGPKPGSDFDWPIVQTLAYVPLGKLALDS